MVWLYYCQACEHNDHAHCELATPSYPPGSFGGRSCTCPCRGNPHWNTPEQLQKGVESFKGLSGRLDKKECNSSVLVYEGFGSSQAKTNSK